MIQLHQLGRNSKPIRYGMANVKSRISLLRKKIETFLCRSLEPTSRLRERRSYTAEKISNYRPPKRDISISTSSATVRRADKDTKSAFMPRLDRQKRANLQITRFKSNKIVQCTKSNRVISSYLKATTSRHASPLVRLFCASRFLPFVDNFSG